MDTTTILLGVVILLVIYMWFGRHSSKYPPCPIRPWPILGHLLLLEKNPREQLFRFREKCGDIYSLYLGTTHVIFLNGYALAKETFVKRGDEFSDKASIFLDMASNTVNKGIAPANGAVWRENRTVSLNILRSFGFGKNILAQKIQEEIDHYVDILESFKGEPKDVRLLTQISISNVMCSIIVGKRFDHNDEVFRALLDSLSESLTHIKGTTLLNYFPCLRFLPGDLFGFKVVAKCFQSFFDIFANVYVKENENITGEANNFIAAYMEEMQRKQSPYLDKSHLLRCILDLFVGGTETSATTIGWLLLYMINYPHVQDKVFKEIEKEVGMGRSPTMQDKVRLPYLSAVIMEAQRVANVAPLLSPRTVIKDTSLGGYILPKGAQIMINMDSILLDKAVWGKDADKFRPERFLSSDGSLLNPEEWIPFSHGRRVCPGEGLAKMELFLFFANIIQKFKLLPADPKNVPPVKGSFGATYVADPYELRFISRKH